MKFELVWKNWNLLSSHWNAALRRVARHRVCLERPRIASSDSRACGCPSGSPSCCHRQSGSCHLRPGPALWLKAARAAIAAEVKHSPDESWLMAFGYRKKSKSIIAPLIMHKSFIYRIVFSIHSKMLLLPMMSTTFYIFVWKPTKYSHDKRTNRSSGIV